MKEPNRKRIWGVRSAAVATSPLPAFVVACRTAAHVVDGAEWDELEAFMKSKGIW